MMVCLHVQKSHASNTAINMPDVNRIMELPVGSILRDAPVSRLNEVEALENVRKTRRPAVLLVYESSDPRSREIATLIRYLSLEFHKQVDFYAFELPRDAEKIGSPSLKAKKILGLEKVPATLFYGKGRYSDSKRDTESPTLTEYRSPGRTFWKACYGAAARFLKKGLTN
jgi:hypothetical protein